MGAGIAQVAAQHGWTVHLQDVSDDVVNDAIAGIRKRFARLVEKERLTADEADAAGARLQVVGGAGDGATQREASRLWYSSPLPALRHCGLFICTRLSSVRPA